MNSPIVLHEVKSSQIKAIGYDKDIKTMFIQFKKGNVYKYEYVTKEEYLLFKNSVSIGKFFHKNIVGNKDLYFEEITLQECESCEGDFDISKMKNHEETSFWTCVKCTQDLI